MVGRYGNHFAIQVEIDFITFSISNKELMLSEFFQIKNVQIKFLKNAKTLQVEKF